MFVFLFRTFCSLCCVFMYCLSPCIQLFFICVQFYRHCPLVESQIQLINITYHIISYHIISCHDVMSCHVVSCRVVSCRVVSCRVVSCRVVPWHVMSRHVIYHIIYRIISYQIHNLALQEFVHCKWRLFLLLPDCTASLTKRPQYYSLSNS